VTSATNPFPTGVDLLRVSQYVEVTLGSGPLYDTLHQLFDADYPPSRLHELLASLPRRLGLGDRRRYQLIMTTNYDDALERAFRAAGEAFDLVWYLAETEDRGKFLHLPPDGEPRLISRPNEYHDLSLEAYGAAAGQTEEAESLLRRGDRIGAEYRRLATQAGFRECETALPL
jgi:hypothetical protein